MNLLLAEKIEKVKTMSIDELCTKFRCSPDEICLGDYLPRYTKDTVCPYKVILGFANFEGSNVTDLGKLEIVFGKLLQDEHGPIKDLAGMPVYLGINLANSLINDLGNLKSVYGSIDLNKNITSLKNVEFLGSHLFLRNTNLQDLGNLQLIDGTLNIEQNKLISFGHLRKVGTLQIGSQIVRDFGEIEAVRKFDVYITNHSTSKLISKEFELKNNKYVRSLEAQKNQEV